MLTSEGAPRADTKSTQSHGYATNLASEFYILSVLHRLGAEATLTLGNKKSVDIVVVRKEGEAITVDVKGVAGKWDWPADNISETPKPRHFLIFVSYEGKFDDVNQLPSVWVVPHEDVARFVHQFKGRRNVQRARLKKEGSVFRDAWSLIV
jgi:hypothetical protein